MKNIRVVFEKINEELESEHKGKIIAIEPQSGDYFIGDNLIEAYDKAIKIYPNKKFIFKKIGFAHTHFIGYYND